jgi:hypothetical protein
VVVPVGTGTRGSWVHVFPLQPRRPNKKFQRQHDTKTTERIWTFSQFFHPGTSGCPGGYQDRGLMGLCFSLQLSRPTKSPRVTRQNIPFQILYSIPITYILPYIFYFPTIFDFPFVTRMVGGGGSFPLTCLKNNT